MTDEVAAGSGFYKVKAGYGRKVPLVDATPTPYAGSGMVAVNFGTAWSVQSNLPPGPAEGLGCAPDLPQAKGTCLGAALCDPHDRAHGLKAHNDQLRWFFGTGEIKDFCGGDGCNPE